MDFKLPYDRNQNINFFRNRLLPEDFEEHEEEVHLSFKPQHIQKVFKIGEVRSLPLTVYEIEHESENDPRVSLSRDSFRFMANYGIQKALILFTSKTSPNYRLSLVTIDLKWEEGKKAEKEYSNPRRYSFFLGPDTKTHTPEEYLIKEGRVKDFDDLKKRFSIEVVNKDFYREIAILFTKLAGGKRKIGKLKFDEQGSLKLLSYSDDTLKKEFSVRLIGRLVFCWFLKKKKSDKDISLLPEDLLSSEALANKSGFYHSVLEPLFFEVLNTPIHDREEKYKAIPWSQVPFLNGGLFTPGNHDFYAVDKLGTSKHLNTLIVPDQWLKELFDVFETYNFTIDENTSVDVELSIEPEMLGRIFENLLAEINPETGETARKATGSYYTPRPIVEYMVDQSLKQYLLTQIPPLAKGGKGGFLNESTISKLLSYEDWGIELTDKEKDSILDALDSIKIIDPACGSGAFPMGILQKMLLILQKVDPESKNWLTRQVAKIDNKIVQKEVEKKLKRENWDYVHKLGIIQNSIYGVDIQPIAVEISKLRFFLSLIVDESIDDKKPNRGIVPLPNLEFKFVAANSLIGLPKYKREETVGLFEATDDIAKLKELRDSYFTSYGEEKKRIEREFEETQKRMFKHSVGWQTTDDSQTMKLSQWNPFSDEEAEWFDPEWMFGIKDGFDITIGNPPYVFGGSKRISVKEKKIFRNLYKSGTKKINLFALFIERGSQLLKEKGVLTYIVPNTLLRVTSYSNIREYIFRNSHISEIVDLDVGVFNDVTASTIIVFLERIIPHNLSPVLIKKGLSSEAYNVLNQGDLENKGFIFDIFAKKHDREIFSKLLSNSIKLEQLAKRIRFGVVISKNIDDVVGQEKINNNWKPFLEGDEIGSYYINYSGRYLFYKKELLHRSRTPDIFETNKILIQRITGGNRPIKAAYDDYEFYNKESLINLILKSNKVEDYKYILGLLNSSLINWFYRNKFTNESKLTVNLSKEYLGEIPIKDTDAARKQLIIKTVDKIHAITKNNTLNNTFLQNSDQVAKVKEYEQQIDEMVYELYDLTPEEIAIVEGVN